MNKQQAEKLFEKYIKSETIKNHCLEVATIMESMAKDLSEDKEKWYVVGFLHDLDYEDPKYSDLKNHTQKTKEILEEKNFPADLIKTIQSHNEEGSGVKREKQIDYVLSAADNISGLIYAYGLMRKSLDGMKVGKLKKRMKDKHFAAKVNRDKIVDIEKADIELDKFLEVSIKAMQSISKEIGF